MSNSAISTSTPSIAEQRRANMEAIAQIRDESEGWWAWTTAGWFLTLAMPLLLFPRLVLFLSAPPESSHREHLTTLEAYLCTHVGIGLLALAIGLVATIPSPPPISRTVSPNPPQQHPLLIPLSVALSATSFVSYNTKHVGALGMIMTIGCGATGIWGLWVMAFQGTGNYSNKTGADKHTSNFFFDNRASASTQKKLWKKERDQEIELNELSSKK